jgi:hypothetical protein
MLLNSSQNLPDDSPMSSAPRWTRNVLCVWRRRIEIPNGQRPRILGDRPCAFGAVAASARRPGAI